ncbi:MAG: DUF3783 domain-containing protein [Spirochaetales bacterium]|nr:DUF3783 domain-containing protein [Spirochaetales bacterium]MCF7937886.1 DUF3783 domain-containing protein [Spirochaetales bacterium]
MADTENSDDQRIVFLHGFNQDQAVRIMRAVKQVTDDPAGIAFSMSTPNNIEWTVKDLISEVREEHEYMRKNPPGGQEKGQ